MLHELEGRSFMRAIHDILSFLMVAALSFLLLPMVSMHDITHANVRSGIAFFPSFPPLPHSVLLLFSGTTSKLLYSYAFLAHTTLS
jgi:hypothetical protein